MKRLSILICIALLSIAPHTKAINTDTTYNAIALQLDSIKSTQTAINQSLKTHIDELLQHNKKIDAENARLCSIVDSLMVECSQMVNANAMHRTEINNRLTSTDASIKEHATHLDDTKSTIYITVILIVIAIIVLSVFFILKMRRETSAIDELQQAQQAMQEEAVDLDSKILELLERQMASRNKLSADGEIDHSLALRIADSIVRIEQNLTNINSSVKGYKRLAKAVKRMRENFQSNGYEIVDLLGKTYDESMEADATFVQDKKLKTGKQKISEVIRPQVKYNGSTIQRAEITVGQKAKPKIVMQLGDSEPQQQQVWSAIFDD